ncbi:nitroreductase family deazaflavin-dependent oxidoreductase [Spirillospora sp. CA-108201]
MTMAEPDDVSARAGMGKAVEGPAVVAPGLDPRMVLDSPTDWVSDHIRRYVETDGEDGHDFPGFPTLLLTTRGRASGLFRRTALIYGQDADRYVLAASNAASANQPHWYLNLCATPVAEVQVRARKLIARARTAEPDKRDRLWSLMTSIFPKYDEYQASTDRAIPLIILEPVAEAAPRIREMR